MTESNVHKERISVYDILKNWIFIEGFNDAYYGNKWSSRYERMNVSEQEAYERGRQFAIVTGGKYPPCGPSQRRISTKAIDVFMALYNNKVII